MLMPGRTFTTATGYRYGFNGKENDNEVKGEANQQDYGMRIYDTRVGRFLSTDPLTSQFPFYSPYQYAGNTPIISIDLDGTEPINFTSNLENRIKREQAILKAFKIADVHAGQLIQAGAGLSILKTFEGAANLVRAQSDPLTATSLGNGLMEKFRSISSDPISNNMMGSNPMGAFFVLLFKDDVDNLSNAIKNKDFVGIGESGTNIAVNAASLYEGFSALKPGAFSPKTFGGMIQEQGAFAESYFGENNLGKTFKTFDQFEPASGTATSIKSIDLSISSLKSVKGNLSKAIKAIENFPGYTQKGFTLDPSMINIKQLKVALYGTQSSSVKNLIQSARLSATSKGINLVTASFGYKSHFLSTLASSTLMSDATKNKKTK
jgi:RHS repeat-associated protein